MKNLCRLCAKEKTSRQLMYSIDDNNLDIEQKLIACCRWNSFIANEQMPKMICAICWKILGKSFAFAETVALAQQQLLNQLIDIKIEVGSLEPINEPIESIDITIAKDEPIDSDAFNELPNRLVEPINILASSMENNESAKFESKYTNINSGMVDEEGRTSNFLCETCGKDFTTRSNLLTHTKMHLPIEKRKHFECYICKATFSGKKIQFQCKECMAHFSRTDALRRHSLIHLNKFTHCCQTCGKEFRTKFNLKVNKMIIA